MGTIATELEINSYPNNILRFTIREPGKLMHGPTAHVWELEIDPDMIPLLFRDVSNCIEKANIGEEEAEIKRVPFIKAGKGIFKSLLSTRASGMEDLRKFLKNLNGPLLLSIDDPQICWELLHDGEEFFCLKVPVGRQLKIHGVPSGVPRSTDQWRCLLIADPNSDETDYALPDTSAESRILARNLENTFAAKVDLLEGSAASLEAVVSRLISNEYDVIHYSGHVEENEALGEYALRLNGGKFFSARSIRDQVQGNPIVFLNACWSGKALGKRDIKGRVNGIPDAFIQAGAQAVIGSLFEVTDEGARLFAEKFYENAFKGEMLGEAIRTARLHVMGKVGMGGAWASFIMYGDPCLKLEVRKDELCEQLRNLQLIREDFDNFSFRVLEKAVDYGRSSGMITSLHLFAAMIEGNDEHLRASLLRQKVSPEKLIDVFQEAFSGTTDGASSIETWRFSDNFVDILKKAKEERSNTRKIVENDLLKSFVNIGGGKTGNILEKIGLKLNHLLPGTNFKNFGPLKEEECTKDCWCLLTSIGQNSSSGVYVNSRKFFLAMFEDLDGPLSKALKRIGLKAANIQALKDLVEKKTRDEIISERRGSTVQISESVHQILLVSHAVALAKKEPIDCLHLLEAFVQQGGGTTGRWFREEVLPLNSLLSQIFREGCLDVTKFESEVQDMFSEMVSLAKVKNHQVMGRYHLLFAMFKNEESALSLGLRKQGIDLVELSDRLFSAMPSGTLTSNLSDLKFYYFSTKLIRIIFNSENSIMDSNSLITDEALTKGMLNDGGDGSASQFLVANGVGLNQLVTQISSK